MTGTVQVTATWRVMRGALMVLGRSGGPLPKAGSARVSSMQGALGVFRLEFWPTESGFAFLAAIRLPERADPPDTSNLLLRGSRATDRDVKLALARLVNEIELAADLAACAPRHAGSVLRFLFDLFHSDDMSPGGPPDQLIEHFLASAAQSAGCIELILNIPSQVVLQGWGTPLAEPAQLVTVRPAPARYDIQVARFDRDDVPAPDTGHVLLLPPGAFGATADMPIYVLTGDALIVLKIINPTPLEAEASLGQVRHLLPRLHGNGTVASCLRHALAPRFSGRDTLNGGTRPVRAALDQAAGAEAAGIYLSGWLYDPASHVARVEICTEFATQRIDDRFVRIPRLDVTEAFRATPNFPPAGNGHLWGFAAEAAIPFDGGAAWLRITFSDEDLAFMPLRVADASERATREALLASVDIHKPSGVAIVEQHLAPFMARHPVPLPDTRTVVTGDLKRPHAIVVSLAAPVSPRLLIASMLQDPLDEDEQIILVCGPAWDQRALMRLTELLSFYDLPATLLASTVAATPISALQAAAEASSADDFLLLSPDAASPHRGWRRAFRWRAVGYDVACPTLLYEDRAIRFAGSSSVRALDRPPYVREVVRQAGLPAPALQADRALPMSGGSFGCALFRRSALAALAPATRFCTGQMQEAAAFRAVEDAGLRLGWLPMLQVVVPDGGAQPGPVPRLVDGWMFRASFAEGRPCAS